jgi:hypothetical protein
MAENMSDDGTLGDVHGEAVGVFDNADALETADCKGGRRQQYNRTR